MRRSGFVTNMSYGGLENLLMNYYRSSDRSKIQFDFLTHVDIHQDFEEEIAALGGRLYRLPRLNPLDRNYLKALDRFFKAHPEYRIVHSHRNELSSVILRAAKQNGVPVRIAHSHISDPREQSWIKILIKRICRKRLTGYTTALFACGQAAGDYMFSGKPYRILTNAIDAGSFRYDPELSRQMRKELDLGDSFVLGHVGQFRQQKNHLFLVEIFAAVLRKHPDARLVLVGKGSQMEPAMQRAEELGVREHIRFLGARADISRLLQAMDVFVMPSFFEGLPVSLVEAQAAGLPCVISDRIPGECKLTPDVEQVSLEAGADAWADAILRYRNVQRPDNYGVISDAGFDIRANALWLENFYRTANTDQ